MALKSAPNESGESSVNAKICAIAARIAIIALGSALGACSPRRAAARRAAAGSETSCRG